MRAALGTFGQALRTAAQGHPAPIHFRSPTGATLASMDAASWAGRTRPGDHALLDACQGSTLDVGCGPGRLLIALGLLGVPALGIDISAEAVAQARRQGGNALLLDVFDPVPGEGNWETVVLADGNVGIGGDPVRLLQRATRLSTPDGRVVVELGSPGSGSWSRLVKLHHAGSHSPAFWWAALAADDVAAPAARARLTITRKWSEAGRWFALLRKEDR